tara:strand:- start:110 stop:274 length:165 start_codon:yes stop_codon:yes gene_type:complete
MAKFNEVRAEKAKNYPKPSRLSKWGGGGMERWSVREWGNGEQVNGRILDFRVVV